MSNKILITGAAGFIGYHLCRSRLTEDYEVFDIDNINNYYDINLKLARLEQLESFKNFKFEKIDIADRQSITDSFQTYKPDIVVNLAAQAGVRYSIDNPYAYLDSNLIGFLNILEICRHDKIDGLIYASSSSVYGSNIKIPFSAEDRTDHPIALYGATKKANELMAHSYSHLYGLHTTGLRYFTVYGSWGRPDMAMYIFTDNIIKDIYIPVYNHGKMKRDFTYIDDIIMGTRSAIEKNYLCEIFNLGNDKSENLMDMIQIIEKNLDQKANIEFKPIQPGDVPDTWADVSELINDFDYKPTIPVKDGVENFTKWFKKYYNC